MAKITMVFGAVLVVLGAGFYFATGSIYPTSLIPAAFGVLLLLSGALANTPDSGRRMLWMHIAVTVGLIGFLMPGFMTVKALVLAHSGPLPRPAATAEQGIMAVICLVFVALCVRSFIAARRERLA